MSRIAVALVTLVLLSQSAFAEDEPVAAASFQLPVLAQGGERVFAGSASLVRRGETTAMLSTIDLRGAFSKHWVAELRVPAAIIADGDTTESFTGNLSVSLRKVGAASDGRRHGFGFRLRVPTGPDADVGRELVAIELERWTDFLSSTPSIGLFADMLLERRRGFFQLHGAIDVGQGAAPGTDGSSERLPMASLRVSAAVGVRPVSRVALLAEATALTGFIPLESNDGEAVFVGARAGARYSFTGGHAGVFVNAPIATSTDGRAFGGGLDISRAF